jgi:DNA helicase-2/ATP-dependent DNA helicase PcrA
LVASPVQLLADVLPRFGLDSSSVTLDVAQEIAWTKQSNVVPERYVAAAAVAGRRVGPVEPDRLADILVEYERVKQGWGLIDFDDILLCAAAVLTESEEAARQMAQRYRHLLVDEFQDVSPIQSRLIELWRGPHQDVCVVGDPAQTIHGFAGARSQYLTDFAAAHRGSRQLLLDRDYRSSAAIVAAANAVMADHGGVVLRSQQPDGPPVVWAQARSSRAEAWAAVEWLADRAAEGMAWSDMALLYRSHVQAAELVTALRERDIPCQVERTTDRLGGAAGPGLGPGGVSPPGVTCTTLHAAEGREWQAVGLVGLSDGLLPHLRAIRSAAIAEERRLLYVGLTRARRYLRVSWVGGPASGQSGPSRFLLEAGLV